MQNVRNRIVVRLVSNKKVYLKRTSKPSYMSQKIFDNYLVPIRTSKVTLKLTKSAYVGMHILDLTKVLMYEFSYDYIKKIYSRNSKLLFTDTDSLMYDIISEDVYEDLDKEMFHFSKYSTKSKYYDYSSKLVVGKMKGETGGITIKEFVGQRYVRL